MTDSVSNNSPSNNVPDLSHYKPQYKIDVDVWRKCLKFKTPLTDQEVHAIADGMIKFMTDFMNQMMKHALDEMKKEKRREKEAAE